MFFYRMDNIDVDVTNQQQYLANRSHVQRVFKCAPLLMGKHQAQATVRNNKKGNRRNIKVLLTEI